MLRQIGFELYKMSRRPRTYLGFAAFALINFFALLGVKYGGVGQMAAEQARNSGFDVVGSFATAEMMAWVVIASFASVPILTMFLPFFISLVFGEMIAGESGEGTLRAMLARPVSRIRLISAEFAACVVYAIVLLAFIGLSAFLMGWIAFGRGGFISMGTFEQPMITYFKGSEALWRLALAYGLTAVGMTALGMIAFFISTWLNNALGAIGGAVMLLFAMFIVGEIQYFESVKPYLISTNLLVGQKAFLPDIPWGEIGVSIGYLGVYISGLFAASWLIFRRKDILT